MKVKQDLESLLKKMINHQISLSFTLHEEGDLRESDGILMDFDEDFIHLKIWDAWGYAYDYYLNRHACTLHSICDYGKED